MKKTIKRRVRLGLPAVLLLLLLLLSGCDENGGASEVTVVEGVLGYRHDPVSGIIVQVAGDMTFLKDCPITQQTFELPTVFDAETRINAVGSHAFFDNDTVEHLIIPDGYLYVCMDSFVNFQNLKTVTIGKDVNLIEELAFSSCPQLCEFIISEENTHFYTSEGCLLKKDTDTLLLSNGKIPSGTKIVGPSVFVDNQNISDMIVPDGVTEIAPLAFNHSSLTSITLPASLTSLGWSAFQGCGSLQELYIPKNVTEVGEKLFSMCHGITVYCEAESKPAGWSDDWLAQSENVTVVWGSTERNTQ